jgi:YD repeat-containing protein
LDVQPGFECWLSEGPHLSSYFSYENLPVQGLTPAPVMIAARLRNKLAPTLGVGLPVRFGVAGRTASVTDGSGRTTTLAYDNANQLVSQTSAGGGTGNVVVSDLYDAAGRRISMSDPTGTTTYAYDAVGNLTSVASPNGDLIGYKWDLNGWRTAITYSGGARVVETRVSNGRLVKVAHPTLGNITYTYDGKGRVLMRRCLMVRLVRLLIRLLG